MDASEQLTRRAALGIGAGAAAAVAAGALPAWARPGGSLLGGRGVQPYTRSRPKHTTGAAGLTEIEYLVLVMLENHSADNILGRLPHFAKSRTGFDGLPVNSHGVPSASNPGTSGQPVKAFPLPDLCPSVGLTQNWNSSHAQYDGGRNDGFVTNVGVSTPMGYLTPEQMRLTYTLASHFPVSDRYFCSVLGQTLPNRRYYFSGTSSGCVNDDNANFAIAAANGTIFDRLDHGKVPWRLYNGSIPSPYYFPNFRNNHSQVARCFPAEQFFAHAADGKLATVTYMEENFGYQSEENPQDIAYGESFLRRVVEAVMHSPHWPKTALFITYDEHGGWFDHVPPPAAIRPDDIPPNLTLSSKGTFPAGFNRYGFRVPLTIVSPWGRTDYISHKVADHTSILAFIEHRFGLRPMTRRDATAWDLSDMIDTSEGEPQLLEPIKLPAAPSIQASLAKCRADGEPT